jgi:hypothetical protein
VDSRVRHFLALASLVGGLTFTGFFHPVVRADGPQATAHDGLVAARARVKLAGRRHAREATVAERRNPAIDDPGGEIAPETRPVSVESICTTVQAAALANDLPVDFFTRLIWQESRFDPKAVSRAGAQGIAQFMPSTAAGRGLADPFDPLEALRESAAFLRELRTQFGNLGLAAAAYNGGPRRVQDWIAKKGGLPRETQNYVRIITGRDVEEWLAPEPQDLATTRVPAVPCPEIAKVLVDARVRAINALNQERTRARVETAEARWAPWGVQLAGNVSEAKALADFTRLRNRFAAILRDRSPIVVKSRVPGRGQVMRHLVRIAEMNRPNAEQLCGRLKSAGASCVVLRNPQPILARR